MRGQMIKEYMANAVFAVCPKYLDSLVATVNSGDIAKMETSSYYSESHGYEKIGSVGVITIDGATIKKNTFINGICGGFVGYDSIAGYIDKAEKDTKVKTILFSIDSVGGEVAGVDTVQDLIATSTKDTVTLYDNIGASASIWYGSASDKIYATEATRIGSIGVKAGWREKGDDGTIWVVSKNAQNKDCSLNGDCKEKIEAVINDKEELFYKRVTSNTGLTDEELAKHFNYGETITATQALEIGFLDGVISKKSLLASLNEETLASMPTIRKNSESTEVRVEDKTIQGHEAMTVEQLQAELDTANATIEAKNKIVGELNKTVASLEKDIQEATATHDTAIEDLTESFGAKSDVMKEAVAMGMELGASKETILEAMDKDTKDGAELAIRREVSSQGSTYQGGEKAIDEDELAKKKAEDKAAKLIAYAEETKIKG